MVISPFCVIKLYYHGNYSGMAVNYHAKVFMILANDGKLKYLEHLLLSLTLENLGNAVNYCGIFYNSGHRRLVV